MIPNYSFGMEGKWKGAAQIQSSLRKTKATSSFVLTFWEEKDYAIERQILI